MASIILRRFSNVALLGVVVFVAWGLWGVIRAPFTIISFWGVGLGFFVAWLFSLSASMRTFGTWKGLTAGLLGLIVIGGSLALNATRGWPFGFAVHNDILGWRLLGVAWPIPVFYSFIALCSVVLMQPKTVDNEPKVLFSWAFDAALLVMFMALLTEPLASTAHVITWISPGSILGTPASALLGWFVTAFVAAVAMILGARLWQTSQEGMKQPVLYVLMGLSALMFGLATNLHSVLSQILTAVAFCLFGSWAFVQYLNNKKKGLTPNVVKPSTENSEA